MTESSKHGSLFSDFPKSSKKDWIRAIETDLKGISLESLTRHTFEGFPVPPVFTKEDVIDLEYLDSHPGEYPFSRGLHKGKNHWLIRQDFLFTDARETNKRVKNAISKGAQAIGFRFRASDKISKSVFENLFKDLRLSEFPVFFEDRSFNGIKNTNEFIEALEALEIDPLDIQGGFEQDLLYQHLLRKGAWSGTEIQDITLKLLEKHRQVFQNFRPILINGYGFSNLTTSITHELAFCLAEGTEYLSWIHGSGINEAFPINFIGFTMGIGPNFFMEIAKLRALRLLWTRIIESFDKNNSSGGRVFITSRPCSWNKTKYDPHTNILRYTSEILSAALGGADAISTLPFDEPLDQRSAMAERISRNAQVLLKEESYLDRICDPSGGSYYIENLTHIIAEEAWNLFQEIEQEGGFINAVESGWIPGHISKLQSQRDADIFNRKTILLGTNHYPNPDETLGTLHAKPGGQDPDHDAPDIPGWIQPYRGAEKFEVLRQKAEEFSGGRPTAVLFPFGAPARRSARVSFSANFLGCGGFFIEDLTGIASVEEGVEACLKIKPEIIVFCSSDEEYPRTLPALVDKIGTHPLLIVAGDPGAHGNDLKKIGIRFFIHQKSDVFSLLQSIQQSIGVE
jgi:methylmalonyl-CoA mutase